MVLLFLLAVACFVVPRASAQTEVQLNQRQIIDLSKGEQRFTFTVTSNNVYTIQSFGGEGVSARLYQGQGQQPIASGEGFQFSARLVADRQYQLVVGGAGGTTCIEIMRDALGRSFDRPQELRDLAAGYDKVIARAYDVHWYKFTPSASGLYMIATRSDLDTVGMLLDESGQEIAVNDDAYEGYERNFLLEKRLTAGQSYYLRVSAKGDAKGRYHLRFLAAEEPVVLPKAIQMSEQVLRMKDGERARLTATIEPDGALGELLWASSDTRVAQVSEGGVVTALGAGQADIVALGFGGAMARCRVTVDAVALTSIRFTEDQLQLPVGEQVPLSYELLPGRASDSRVRFESSDERVLRLDGGGNATGVGEGVATVTIRTMDGALTDTMRVTVVPKLPVRRALVMGVQRYQDGRVRDGSVNTTQGMADLLREQSFSGYGYEVTMKMDPTAGEALRYIQEAFKDAQKGDVSLFYVNCHGKYKGGTAYLEMQDGSTLTAQQLESALRKVPGTVVVMIDCCNSGSFINLEQSRAFGKRVVRAFAPKSGGSFAMSKYRVLCSSSATQDSHRYAQTTKNPEANMSTAFARALCEAGGWDLIADRRMPMRADLDKDKRVTLNEAYRYAYQRVKQFLDEGGLADRQDVQVYPQGSQFVLFSRE